LSWCQRRVSKTRIPQNTHVPRQSPLEPHKQRPVHALPCCARVVVPRTVLDRGGGCCFRQNHGVSPCGGTKDLSPRGLNDSRPTPFESHSVRQWGDPLSLSSRSRDRHDDLYHSPWRFRSSPDVWMEGGVTVLADEKWELGKKGATKRVFFFFFVRNLFL
jgi:hypothetical protein